METRRRPQHPNARGDRRLDHQRGGEPVHPEVEPDVEEQEDRSVEEELHREGEEDRRHRGVKEDLEVEEEVGEEVGEGVGEGVEADHREVDRSVLGKRAEEGPTRGQRLNDDVSMRTLAEAP